ncbi:MAG TPA: GNAT family N-acetyltransferase [Solirubrobacterales bacterium]|jgi:ribosomal protein S18 acetylase RimI-like enzyme|nr:GNAT family N-acetyltransferase [Solirubrobacterales bacterium]
MTETAAPITIEDLPSDSLEEIREIWLELHEHHIGTDPTRAAVARPRTAEQAWRFRRPAMERWLREPGAFALVARDAAAPVGFAVATVKDAPGTWDVGDRIGVLDVLAVAASRRRQGIGGMLTSEVSRRLAADGISMMQIEVLATNEEASRFYERMGAAESSRLYWLLTKGDN